MHLNFFRSIGSRGWIGLVVMGVALAGGPSALAQNADIKGAQDYPGIGRFAGSVITGYQVKNFDAMRLQAAPFANRKPVDARRLEGKITRIAWRAPAGAAILEVARNFETQLEKAGFAKLMACESDACGGIPFVESVDALPIPQMWIDAFNYRYYAAHKQDGGREIYASVLASKNNDNTTVQLVVAEIGAIENKMVDAAQMAKGLGEKGHIALYGIYFDTDKATLKPESKATLDEMSKLLGSQPGLRVFIVGHTDSQGGYEHNMTLSRQRAESVIAALVTNYRIDRSRLYPAGVGYLAPIGSNATEAGRALNRRVELVAP